MLSRHTAAAERVLRATGVALAWLLPPCQQQQLSMAVAPAAWLHVTVVHVLRRNACVPACEGGAGSLKG
jgi:hypothetical protein